MIIFNALSCIMLLVCDLIEGVNLTSAVYSVNSYLVHVNLMTVLRGFYEKKIKLIIPERLCV